MSVTHVVGVDPGLVHTGVVSMIFSQRARMLEIEHTVIDGPNATAVVDWVNGLRTLHPMVYVEQYKPRQNLSSDPRMTQVQHELQALLPRARFLPNMGIKRVITADLMRLVEVWKFPTATHHQDLRAAARIGLLGMVKHGDTNPVLADLVQAHIDGTPWSISHE